MHNGVDLMISYSPMMTPSNGNNIYVTDYLCGEFPTQRPVMRSFDIFFDLCLNKRLSKQSWGWWFETLSCPLWRQCNALSVLAFAHCTSDVCWEQENGSLKLINTFTMRKATRRFNYSHHAMPSAQIQWQSSPKAVTSPDSVPMFTVCDVHFRVSSFKIVELFKVQGYKFSITVGAKCCKVWKHAVERV